MPDVSEDMLEGVSRRSVRVRFSISASGDADASLLGSTGSSAVDAIVLRAANRWRFRPAMRDGEPVSSSLRLRVEIR
jgi:protein TonB